MAGKKLSTNPKYKLTVSLSADLAARFAAYAGYMREDQCSIIERAIKRELIGFRVSMSREDAGSAPTSEPTVRIHDREAV